VREKKNNLSYCFSFQTDNSSKVQGTRVVSLHYSSGLQKNDFSMMVWNPSSSIISSNTIKVKALNNIVSWALIFSSVSFLTLLNEILNYSSFQTSGIKCFPVINFNFNHKVISVLSLQNTDFHHSTVLHIHAQASLQCTSTFQRILGSWPFNPFFFFFFLRDR